MSYSVVILSKNAANLQDCLYAIATQNPGCRVIVVDDGLTPRPIWLTIKHWPEYVPGVKPFIFARNANIGIAAAGEDDVILLNDDALLRTEHGFDRLGQMARAMEEYAIVSPAISGVGNENQSLYADWKSEPRPINKIRIEHNVLVFACVYIRRDVLNKLGPLDERFTSYGWEDNDYCRRALAAGYKLGIYDPVQVDHSTLKSSFRGFGHCDMTYNQRIYEQKWGLSDKPPFASRADSD